MSTVGRARGTSSRTGCSMRPSLAFRSAAGAQSSSRCAMAEISLGPPRPILTVRSARGMRCMAYALKLHQLRAGSSPACFRLFRKARIISTSLNAERGRRSLDTGVGTGPFFSSSRRPSLPGQCRQTPVLPRDPFTGRVGPLHRRRSFDCRVFRASGSLKAATASRSGRRAMPLLPFLPSCLGDRSPSSCSGSTSPDLLCLLLLAPRVYLRPLLRDRFPMSTCHARASTPRILVLEAGQVLDPLNPSSCKEMKRVTVQYSTRRSGQHPGRAIHGPN